MARKSPKITRKESAYQILKYDLKQEVEKRVAVRHGRDVLWRQGQAGCELPACLSYTARPCLERKVQEERRGKSHKAEGTRADENTSRS